MTKEKRRPKTVLIRKSDIKRVVIYPEVREISYYFFGKGTEEITKPAVGIIICGGDFRDTYSYTLKSDDELNLWYSKIKEELEDSTKEFLEIYTEDKN